MRYSTLLVFAALFFAAARAEPGPSQVRSDFQNGVLVEVTMVDLTTTIDQGLLAWNVYFETHSGDLRPLALEDRARLHGPDGATVTEGFAFESMSDSAHHPTGRLTLRTDTPAFAALLAGAPAGEALSVTLTIHDLAGVPERSVAFLLDPASLDASQALDATTTAPLLAYVANAGDGTISVVDLGTYEEVARWRIGDEASHGLALEPGALYAGSGEEGVLVVLDPFDGREFARYDARANAHGIDRTPDGRYVFVGAGGTAEEAHIVRLDTSTGDLLHAGPGLNPVGHIDASPDGNRLYVANLGTDTVSVLAIDTLRAIAVVPVGDGPNESRVTPDGQRLFVANWNSSDVSVVDTNSLSVIATVRVGEGTHGVAITPDGREAWITNRISNDIVVLDTTTLELLARMPAGAYANHVTFTPDGDRAVVSNARANEIMVFDRARRDVVATIPVGLEPHEIAIGPRTPTARSAAR